MKNNKSTMDKQLICMGCGLPLQNTDPSGAGYTPATLDNDKTKYCQRCFRLQHYGDNAINMGNSNKDFLDNLKNIKNKPGLIVYVTDVMDFNASLINNLTNLVGKKELILVGNKADLLPASYNPIKLMRWLKDQAKLVGDDPKDVVLTSVHNKASIEKLLKLIEKYSNNKDIYFVGTTNVGKSSLLNAIIKLLPIKNKQFITTSYFPATTLGKISFPLNNKQSLIDTPGLVASQQLVHHVNEKELKYITATKSIKPKTYQLEPAQSIFLGRWGRFDYISGPDKEGFTLYLNNNINLHRTKLNNSDVFYDKHQDDLLTPKKLQGKVEALNLVKHEFKVDKRSDLLIEGLGWITIPAGVKVAGWAPKGVEVKLRPVMF